MKLIITITVAATTPPAQLDALMVAASAVGATEYTLDRFSLKDQGLIELHGYGPAA